MSGQILARTSPSLSSVVSSHLLARTWPSLQTVALLHTTDMLERARQSTRIKKRKVALASRKKKEERLRKNPPPIPRKVVLMLKSKGLSGKPQPWRKPDEKPFPVDQVWSEAQFTWNRLEVEEALDALREHYDPTMLNQPDAIVWAKVEFNMAGAKQDKYIEDFSKMVPIYHPFESGLGAKQIMVFANEPEDQKAAESAGAAKAGGLEMIEEIAKGRLDVAEYDYFLSHEDLLKSLKPLVGVLREKFPKKLEGTVGTDLEKMVKTFSHGILTSVKKPKKTLGYADDPSYGYCEMAIGRLSMESRLVKENLTTLMETMAEKRPTTKKPFINKCQLYVDGPLNSKFAVIHDLVEDVKYRKHIKELATAEVGL